MKDGVKYHFGEKLREIRERKGFTMKYVANTDNVVVVASIVESLPPTRESNCEYTNTVIIDEAAMITRVRKLEILRQVTSSPSISLAQ